MWNLKLGIVYDILASTVHPRDQLDGWFISTRLSTAPELDKAALIRFPWLPCPGLLQPCSPLPLPSRLFTSFDLPGTPRSDFRPALQINSSIQWVNTAIDMLWQSEGHNIMPILLCVSHRALVFIRMRKVCNKCYYCWYLVTVLSLA